MTHRMTIDSPKLKLLEVPCPVESTRISMGSGFPNPQESLKDSFQQSVSEAKLSKLELDIANKDDRLKAITRDFVQVLSKNSNLKVQLKQKNKKLKRAMAEQSGNHKQ